MMRLVWPVSSARFVRLASTLTSSADPQALDVDSSDDEIPLGTCLAITSIDASSDATESSSSVTNCRVHTSRAGQQGCSSVEPWRLQRLVWRRGRAGFAPGAPSPALLRSTTLPQSLIQATCYSRRG